jgi:2-succinyl-5-enolpyruvyl-6-hydroxy-3-cyclohexene-1-carboxylate synthase
LEEPLYELVSELPTFPTVEKQSNIKNMKFLPILIADWNTSQRIMILGGNKDYSPELENQLTQLVKNHSVVVLSEANSNLYHENFSDI